MCVCVSVYVCVSVCVYVVAGGEGKREGFVSRAAHVGVPSELNTVIAHLVSLCPRHVRQVGEADTQGKKKHLPYDPNYKLKCL